MSLDNSNGFKILALDLDDTLLRSDLSISHRTINAIRQTAQLGVTVVLASGRIYAAMNNFSRLLGLHERPGYLICNNGALILETHSGNIVYEAKLDKEIILTVCDLADAEGFALQMYDNDIMYVSRQNEYSNIDQRTTGLRQVVVENFKDMAGDGYYKLIIPGDPELLKHIEIIIRTYLGQSLTIFTSRPHFLEITPEDTDKGTALAKVAKLLKVRKEQTMAIGDSMNDEAMIRWAGIGVAMANGDERIKSMADLVTEHTNDEDGVAEIIEKYFFDKEKKKKKETANE
jgi:Cof subfamily protein (haloacid dehalogenase superfamily)